MTDPTIDRLDLTAYVDQAVAVQAAALGSSDARRRDVFLRHATYPGYRGLGLFAADLGDATGGARLVGFTYGYDCRPGGWWRETAAPALMAAGHAAWLDDAFEITEVHVHPRLQARGHGRRLLTMLLGELPHSRALLSAYDEPTPARRFYRSLGFVDLLTGFRFTPDGRPYAVMGLRLPLAGRPAAVPPRDRPGSTPRHDRRQN